MSARAPIETDALIIGAGPVGLFQAFQLGLLEISCHIVDTLPHAGGQCAELYGNKPLYDIPGTPATTGQGLVDALLAQVAPFRPTMHLGEQVATLAREPDGRWRLGTDRGSEFIAKTVFIAAGVGAFVPRRVTVEGIDAFEGSKLFYHPADLGRFAGQSVVVQGGDDAALDTALALVGQAAHVTLLHRRDGFQADPARVAALRAHVADGTLGFVVGQPSGFDGDELEVTLPDTRIVSRPIDALIACLGISPRLGPIAEWGLELERKQVPVDTEKFETRAPGVFAVGDINTYPGKRKLIVCGFHEATLAAWGAAAIVFPGKAIPLQYTTTSTRLHRLLGVAPG
ncbi:NAD(P)/FAD-dependent oxidoreductase [Variovorax guangxiensis]|uniref:Ferredoxin--NADP reductase n=1 Tax=Variovorax guangxiensis TaxID=1775474 RepID=A0A502E036_9BURK|nr:NAD(P)/FAD-dependent oxidoreductase [Variovorax guangxiensis]TPG26554.1 NAD(P)/FAD-dependent oxidoreductase [Variovorax ginsengisoli]TPG30279.1 NAD(P)/FAD-dependent oxidoreductase [Variovorax guangxiensis]